MFSQRGSFMAITRREPTEEYLAELMDDCTAMIVGNFELENPEQNRLPLGSSVSCNGHGGGFGTRRKCAVHARGKAHPGSDSAKWEDHPASTESSASDA
jgi:hypothetical protein